MRGDERSWLEWWMNEGITTSDKRIWWQIRVNLESSVASLWAAANVWEELCKVYKGNKRSGFDQSDFSRYKCRLEKKLKEKKVASWKISFMYSGVCVSCCIMKWLSYLAVSFSSFSWAFSGSLMADTQIITKSITCKWRVWYGCGLSVSILLLYDIFYYISW